MVCILLGCLFLLSFCDKDRRNNNTPNITDEDFSYICPNGTPDTGATAEDNGTERCVSCNEDDGFLLFQGECENRNEPLINISRINAGGLEEAIATGGNLSLRLSPVSSFPSLTGDLNISVTLTAIDDPSNSFSESTSLTSPDFTGTLFFESLPAGIYNISAEETGGKAETNVNPNTITVVNPVINVVVSSFKIAPDNSITLATGRDFIIGLEHNNSPAALSSENLEIEVVLNASSVGILLSESIFLNFLAISRSAIFRNLQAAEYTITAVGKHPTRAVDINFMSPTTITVKNPVIQLTVTLKNDSFVMPIDMLLNDMQVQANWVDLDEINLNGDTEIEFLVINSSSSTPIISNSFRGNNIRTLRSSSSGISLLFINSSTRYIQYIFDGRWGKYKCRYKR